MIHCSDQFEVYDTETLDTQRSLITNFGGKRIITGVRNSLATDDNLAITFLENKTVNRLSRDATTADSPVRIDELITLDLPEFDQFEEVFVMDGAVAVRVNDTKFEFFLMPLVTSQTVKPLPRAPLTTNELAFPFDYSKLIDYGFAPNKKQAAYTLFGLREEELVKIVFTLNEDTM